MIFFPPFLGGAMFRPDMTHVTTLIPFMVFCLASSSTYILNDIIDAPYDCHHPEKIDRPIPSGIISKPLAAGLCFTLSGISMFLAWSVSLLFCAYVVLYLLITVSYSVSFKNFPLMDIFCVSAGFVVRLLAGGAAFGIRVSEWLFLSVFLLSLFLATGKRMAEKNRLGNAASMHRKVLDGYPANFLDTILIMTGSAVLVTYSMYVIARNSILLLYTVPLCCFGLLRYAYRIQSGKSGDPTESLIKDLPLLIVGIVWAFLVGWGIYGPR